MNYPFFVSLGHGDRPHLRLEVVGYAHPDVAEPEDLDLLRVQAHASAAPVATTFEFDVGVYELRELRAYLEEINSGNGPMRSFPIAGGMLTLSFAPSRRGPVLCSVLLKSIDASHLRVEYLVTLEPEAITATLGQLRVLDEV
jgi:hypothetical protein